MRKKPVVRLSLASSEDVLTWSSGEVTKAETVNYRTGRAELGGLFCPKIFGPEQNWRCRCGKYRGMRYNGRRCDRCDVEVLHSRVRRQRMGHINLAAPVAHIWFFKLRTSRIGTLLAWKASEVEDLIYFQKHLVVEADASAPCTKGELLTEDEYRSMRRSSDGEFRIQSGAEAIESLLQKIDLTELARNLRTELAELERKPRFSKQHRDHLVKRLALVETLLNSGNRPEWMVLRRLPVIPPDLRPLVLTPTGGYVTSDLNELYRRVINRNLRLKRLLSLDAPSVILRNEKRLLQLAVDALFDNSRLQRPVLGAVNRPLRSLADMLTGKQGRFRENLLGKRVDYSGRSVIVVGPELALHQCGLPKRIAVELYEPFVVGRLLDEDLTGSVKAARQMVRRRDPKIWSAVESAMTNHPVLLNRAPTLHRMNIQAFEPVLVEGNAIRLNPLACKAFNADFDGDQMAVHLPLSVEAQVEAKVLMLAPHNVFSPANGRPVIGPAQDMVLGCYYFTSDAPSSADAPLGGEGMVFSGPHEAIAAYQQGRVAVQAHIHVRFPKNQLVYDGSLLGGSQSGFQARQRDSSRVLTTMGRILFNEILPAGMAFYNAGLTAKHLSEIIADCSKHFGRAETVALLNRLQKFGFWAATKSGLSFALSDLRTPGAKSRVVRQADRSVDRLRKHFHKGLVSDSEKLEATYDIWQKASREIELDLLSSLGRDRGADGLQPNPVFLMAHSGARGGWDQVRQLAGMRGLMARPSGEIVETPIRSSFREGLSVAEYFLSTHGARKGLADTALKTSQAGYLTRKLADAAQDVIVTTEDCRTDCGVEKSSFIRGGQPDGNLREAIAGRVSLTDVRRHDELIVAANELIEEANARRIEASGIERVWVRSPLTCRARQGVCRLCYGADLSSGNLVEIGTAVGVIAAQSLGEPCTQLVMRTFHVGGAVSASEDITTGLPKLIQLFEARNPKTTRAILAEASGRLEISDQPVKTSNHRRLRIHPLVEIGNANPAPWEQRAPLDSRLIVRSGQMVHVGDPLTEGPVSFHDLLKVGGRSAVMAPLLDALQSVYRSQNVVVNDIHFEIIISCMLRRVLIVTGGDTKLLPGESISLRVFEDENQRLKGLVKIAHPGDSTFRPGELVSTEAFDQESARLKKKSSSNLPRAEKGKMAKSRAQLMGVSQVALGSQSFLSAASFQQTAQALANAALAGKRDCLIGLKENVMLGELPPCGAGFQLRQNDSAEFDVTDESVLPIHEIRVRGFDA